MTHACDVIGIGRRESLFILDQSRIEKPRLDETTVPKAPRVYTLPGSSNQRYWTIGQPIASDCSLPILCQCLNGQDRCQSRLGKVAKRQDEQMRVFPANRRRFELTCSTNRHSRESKCDGSCTRCPDRHGGLDDKASWQASYSPQQGYCFLLFQYVRRLTPAIGGLEAGGSLMRTRGVYWSVVNILYLGNYDMQRVLFNILVLRKCEFQSRQCPILHTRTWRVRICIIQCS
jgi:hypothetical protein